MTITEERDRWRQLAKARSLLVHEAVRATRKAIDIAAEANEETLHAVQEILSELEQHGEDAARSRAVELESTLRSRAAFCDALKVRRVIQWTT